MTRFVPGQGLDTRVAARFAVPRCRELAEELANRVRANAPNAGTWQTWRDERVRPSHRAADGQTIPDNLRFILPRPNSEDWDIDDPGSYEMARAPRDPDLTVANRYACFPGWVSAAGVGVRASLRAWYEGPLVSLGTASGRIFASTSNHPILTDRGWVPAGQLEVGDNLIQASISDLCQAGNLPVEPDIEQRPAPLVQIHRALAELGLTQRMPSSAVDLYGDPIDGEVEVVAANRQLRLNGEPTGSQLIGEPLLILPDPPRPRPGHRIQFRLRVAAAARRLVSSVRPCLSLFRRAVRHAQLHRSTTPPRFDTGGEQQPPNPVAGDAMLTSERLLRFPGQVATDELVYVDVRPWAGHVYTLSTDIGAYTVAGGIVVANCRCEALPIQGLIAQHVAAGDTVLTGAVARAVVSVSFTRIVESEYPSPEDGGGGWLARSVEEVRAAGRGSV